MGEHEKTNPRVWVKHSQIKSFAEVWGQHGSQVEQKALPMQSGGLLLVGSVVLPGEAKASASAGALRGGIRRVCAPGFVHSNFLSRQVTLVDFHCTVARSVSLFPWVVIKN